MGTEPYLLGIIGLLLLYISWERHSYNKWVRDNWKPVLKTVPPPPVPKPPPPPTKSGQVAKKPVPIGSQPLPPNRELPFLLERKVNAGWGTIMDLAPTRKFEKIPLQKEQELLLAKPEKVPASPIVDIE